MIQELKDLQEKYRRLTESLSDPAFISNPQKIREIAKERAELEPVVRTFGKYQKVVRDLEEAGRLLDDPQADGELRALAEQEVELLRSKEMALESELRILLLPKDPFDGKNVILEIRAGAGGDEASLFAQDLMRM